MENIRWCTGMSNQSKRTDRNRGHGGNRNRSDMRNKRGNGHGSSNRDRSIRNRSQEIKERFLGLAKLKIKSLSKRPDLAIIHISRLMVELDDIINVLSGRLYDWFSVYNTKALDRKKVLEYVGNGINDPSTGFPTNDKYAKNGVTILFDEIQRLINMRSEYKTMLDDSMSEVAPNISALVGPDLGAKLIAHVGSLEKLAILPASTIQVMGAEKALFKHLKNKNIPSPKHGLIFQHPFISGVAKRLRGKMARAIANELAVAARADAFTHRNISKLLISRLKISQTRILASQSSTSNRTSDSTSHQVSHSTSHSSHFKKKR